MGEIFSRWFSLGGDLINIGLPYYVQMDHKTYDGFKIQDTYLVRIMVIIKLKSVKDNTAY